MLDTLVGAYESVFLVLGLGSPWKRLILGALVGFGGQLLLKPSISYKRDGTAKSFPQETLLPWYAVAIIPGLVFALFL